MIKSEKPPEIVSIRSLFNQKEIIAVVADAVADAIGGYTSTKPIQGQPALKASKDSKEIAVLGMIRFESLGLSFELFLGLSKDLFLNLYQKVVPMPVDEISSENHDLAGELLNIAFGVMDPKFREKGYQMVSSFPQIYSGPELTKALKGIDAESITIPFTIDGQQLSVELYAGDSLKVNWKYDPGVKKSA